MFEVSKISIDELSPCIRKAGKQNTSCWKNKPRKIYDHEFLYCCEGKAHMIIDNTKYDMIPSSLTLVKPNKPHLFWTDKKDYANIFWVHFDFIFRKDIYSLNKLVSTNNKVLYNKNLPYKQYIRHQPILENNFVFPEFIIINQKVLVKDIFEKILFYYKSDQAFWQLECKILLLELFKIIINQVTENSNASINFKNISSIVMQYVYKNYYRKLSLKEIANVVAISEDYLSKLFKKQVGENLTHFINKTRLIKAKELLINSNLTITNIAEIVGFSDVYYFSKVMKKYEGVSPSYYRKKFTD